MFRFKPTLLMLSAFLIIFYAACDSQDTQTDPPNSMGGNAPTDDLNAGPGGARMESDEGESSYIQTNGAADVAMNAAPTADYAAAGASAPMPTASPTTAPVTQTGVMETPEVEIPKENTGDMYQGVGTNPFVIVAHDPFSTFAADVDTASYDIFRRDINQGMLPQPNSVRLEEYINNFAYDYPAPESDSEHPFSISLQAAPDLFENGTTLLRVGIQGELPPEREAANVVFLIDTSGSMTDPLKLPLVQHILASTVDLLKEGDKISIVTYAGSVGVKLAPTDASEKPTIKKVIYDLTSGGSTAGAAGIDLAYEQAEDAFVEGGINQVILCTDGDFNVGPSSDAELVSLIEEKRQSGVTLTVLGFGIGNLNDSMMEQVSNAGNGIYAMISNFQQADDYVEKKMISNLVQIAKDMKIQVEFNPEKVHAYRLLGYENRDIADEDFRDDTVDAGEIGAGHRVTALYELVLEGDSIPEFEDAPEIDDGDPVEGDREIDTEEMVLVKVRYKDVDAAEDDEAYEVSTTLADTDIKSDRDDADEDFRWAVAIAAFAEILKESPYANTEALDSIEDIITEKNWLDADRIEFVELFSSAKGLIAARP